MPTAKLGSETPSTETNCSAAAGQAVPADRGVDAQRNADQRATRKVATSTSSKVAGKRSAISVKTSC